MGGSSGGGSSSQPVDQTITQTQFPAEAKPYYQRLLSRGEAESLQPYGAYPAQRLAQFAPEEQQAFGMTTHLANQGTPWAMQQAQQTAGQQARGRPFEPWTGFQPRMPQPRIPDPRRWGPPQENNLGLNDRGLRQPMYGGQMGPQPIAHDLGGGNRQAPKDPNWVRDPNMQTLNATTPPGVPVGRPQQPMGQGFYPQQRGPMTPPPQPYGRRPQRQQPWQQDTTLMGANYGIPGMSGGYQTPMQRYMSPYQQGVTDIAKEESIRDADRMRSEIGLNAASQGGLGGYREGIVESNLNRDLMRNLSDIQTQGLQSGYQSAQQQFGADRAARLGQEGAQLGAAQLLGGFAPQTQQMALQRIGSLGGVGGQRRGFRQAGMDIGYEDFLRQQGYPRQQIGFQSNIIRGLGLQPSQTVSSYAQRPGLFQQTLGAGLGALGLYQGMGGGRPG